MLYRRHLSAIERIIWVAGRVWAVIAEKTGSWGGRKMFRKLRAWSISLLVGLASLGFAGAQTETATAPIEGNIAITPINTADLHQIMRMLQSLPVQIPTSPPRPRVAVIYDGSRSMLSSMSASEPISKAQVAAEAFETVMPLLMQDADVDILRFGGEAQGTCWPQHAYSTQQGKVRVPSAAELDSWQAVANSPSAQGSPLWLSVQAAAEIMRAQGDAGGSIVLLSDGRDQCPETPENVCERMVDLGNEGFTVHVLSVNAPRADRPGLRCIANNTGGVFAHASDPASVEALLGVLTRVAQAESHTKAVEQAHQRLRNLVESQTGQAVVIERELGEVISDITAANRNLATLQDDLASHLDRDISVLQIAETIDVLRTKVDGLTKELTEASQVIRVLQVRMDEANQTIGDRDDIILGMEKEILRLRGVSDRFHKSLGRKTQQISELMIRGTQIEQKLIELHQENMSLKDQVGILEASLVEQVASSMARAGELKNQCDQSIRDLKDHHQTHLSPLQAELMQCKATKTQADRASESVMSNLRTEISELKAQSVLLEEAVVKAQADRNMYRTQYGEERNKHSALLTTLAELQSDRESLKARIAVAEAANKTQAAEIIQCKASLDLAIGERGGFTAALENCQSEKDQLRAELDHTRSELSTVRAKLSAANRALNNAHKGNQALQLSLFDAQQDAKAGATRIIALEARIVEQEGTIVRLEDILRTMKACRHDLSALGKGKRGQGPGAGHRDGFKQFHEGMPDGEDDQARHEEPPKRDPRHHQCGGDERGTKDEDRHSDLRAPDTIIDLGPNIQEPEPVERTSGDDIMERLQELSTASLEILL